MTFDADGIFWTRFIAEQTTLACTGVDLECFEVNDIGEWAGVDTDATACAVFFFDVWTRADQPCAVEGCAEMFATLCEPGVGIIQGIHHPEDEAVEGLLFWQTKLFNNTDIFT